MPLEIRDLVGKNTVSLCDVFPENIFMKGFLSDLYLRPSCYACTAKCGKSNSDITIGDLWGAPSIIGGDDDDRGISLILLNKDRLDLKNVWMREIDYQTALTYNPAIERSAIVPDKRKIFYADFDKTNSLYNNLNNLTKRTFLQKVFYLAKRIVKVVIKRL